MSKQPHPHLLQAQQALALLLSKLVGRLGTEGLPSTIAPLSLSVKIVSSLDSLQCSGDSIKRLFDITSKTKQIRKKSERKL